MLKNITLSAEQELIRRAREKATKEKTTLNKRFREWLGRYTQAGNKGKELERMMKKQLNYAQSGGKFTRDELNER